jgi:hypothetical protein
MRTFHEVNSDYNRLCAIVGDFFIKHIFDNPDMLTKYKEFTQLAKEAKEIEAQNKEDREFQANNQASND